jgi:hypothetical protein
LATPLDQGRPFKAYSVVLLQLPRTSLLQRNSPRWFGVLVLTAANLVLFFPALDAPIEWIRTTAKGTTSTRVSFVLDHLTLDPTGQRWHFTSTPNHEHMSAGRARRSNLGHVIWFGLSISTDVSLRKLLSTNILTFEIPPSDADRRLAMLKEAQRTVVYHKLTIPREARKRFEPGFLHAVITAAPPGVPDYHGLEWLLPLGSPSLTEPIPSTLSNFNVSIHRIPLGDAIEIQVALIWLPGAITVPAVFTTFSNL